jgi:hypothetical protein
VNEPANVGDALARSRRGTVEGRVHALGVIADDVASGLELEGERGERRPELVVQVVPQPPPLFLAGEDQPLARAPQIVGEPDSVDGHRDLARDRLECAAVRSCERAAGDQQLPDALAAVAQIEDLAAAAWPVVEPHEHDREAQRARDGLLDGGQHVLG